MVSLPRFVVAAAASGQGKTTITTGIIAALTSRGLTVQGFKVGPDFIDPGYHALASGRVGRNLDPFLVGEQRIAPLLAHGARGADISVIEGVMGLFDGQLTTQGFGSTAHVASLVCAPVVLCLDASHASRSVAAVALGLTCYDPAQRFAGVIINKVATPRHRDEVLGALEGLVDGRAGTLADRVEAYIRDNDLDMTLEYGAFPDRPYDSPGVWGDPTRIRRILASSAG